MYQDSLQTTRWSDCSLVAIKVGFSFLEMQIEETLLQNTLLAETSGADLEKGDWDFDFIS